MTLLLQVKTLADAGSERDSSFGLESLGLIHNPFRIGKSGSSSEGAREIALCVSVGFSALGAIVFDTAVDSLDVF
jgi:hypothetical protein